jgi:hypothetical protein
MVFAIMVERVRQLLDFEQACQPSSFLFSVTNSSGATSWKTLALDLLHCPVEISKLEIW